ncbi:MAG TPA: LuxR C-terminal-related transcriptional regulator [Chryseolinea sp.]
MKKSVFLYGISLALLVYVLKLIEYRYYVRDLSLGFYLTLIALLFGALGAWFGGQLVIKRIHSISSAFNANATSLKLTGISKREYDVLTLISKGDTNQQIADKLFLSLNTVKTHSSSLYVKLGAKRRTQAVQKAKELKLIP